MDQAIKTRARGASQKAERRQNILDAAETLFACTGYQDISMIAVAQSLGLSKGTLYLYFESKESLFLALTGRALNQYFDQTNGALSSVAGSTEDLAATLISGFNSLPLLPFYLSSLHTVFEHNVELETVVAFKHFLLEKVTITGQGIDTAMQWPDGSGAQLLIRSHALIIGLQHMAAPSSPVAQALKDPALHIFRIDFIDSLTDTLPLLLRPLSHSITSGE